MFFLIYFFSKFIIAPYIIYNAACCIGYIKVYATFGSFFFIEKKNNMIHRSSRRHVSLHFFGVMAGSGGPNKRRAATLCSLSLIWLYHTLYYIRRQTREGLF